MKKVINLLLAVLVTGCINAQWVYENIDNGFDKPYKIAYTTDNATIFLKLEYVDSSVVFYVQGGYYCDDKPIVDVVFVVNGVNKKYSFIGDKSEDSDVMFISWYFELYPEAVEDFKSASLAKIRINETYCTTEIYSFKMTNSRAAYNFIAN